MYLTRRVVPLKAGIALLFVLSVAHAEGSGASTLPSAPAHNAESAPDIVRLKDGGMVRGTIAEMDPRKNVVIVTLTGEKRTFAMSLVAYAGARGGEPTEEGTSKAERSEPRSKLSEAGDRVRVSFRAEGELKDLTLHMQLGTAEATAPTIIGHFSSQSYTRICSAPCEAKLAPGSYVFALSSTEYSPIAVAPLDISGNSTLTGTYVSHDSRRAMGWLVLVSSIVVGGAIAVGPNIKGNDGLSLPALSAGVVIAGVGSIVGASLAATDDEASMTLSK